MYVFLSDNVLVTSATGKPPSLGSWAEDVAGLVITEKGTTSKVDVLELTAERLRIRIHGKTTAEITFAPAIRPPAPPPAAAASGTTDATAAAAGGRLRSSRSACRTDAVPTRCGSPSRTTRPTSRGPTARRWPLSETQIARDQCLAAHVQRRAAAGRRRHERGLHARAVCPPGVPSSRVHAGAVSARVASADAAAPAGGAWALGHRAGQGGLAAWQASSAWERSRPCPPPGTPRGRRRSRWR